MKILELTLAAFGPFTGQRLDFSVGPSFHMVYGPNEAGKSTALRALRGLLFGIPARTPDAFHHPYASLRIGARLVSSAGAEIAFVRRKGQSKTLRGPDDQSIVEDSALAPFLGGVGQELFEQMFAIGHADLVSGGQEIISGGGNVGKALFAAGAGLIHLQAVQTQMLQQCEALFKPGGSKPAINSTLSALAGARRDQKEALLPAKNWKAVDQGLRDARQEREQIQQRLDDVKKQCGRLERIRDGFPFISRKKEIDAALDAFRDVPDLPPDVGDNRRKAETDLQLAGNDLQRAKTQMEALFTQLEALSVPENLLRHAAAIEALQQDLGSHRKARKDRPDRLAKMLALQHLAAENLSEVKQEMKSDTRAGVTLPAGVVGELQEMKDAHGRLATRQEAALESLRELTARMEGLLAEQAALPAPVAVTTLKTALEEAQSAGPIETQLGEGRRAAADLRASLTRDLRRQTVWPGQLADLDGLPCPAVETIDHYREKMTAAERTMEKLTSDRLAAEAEVMRTAGQLDAMARTVDVPLASDLSAARSVRTQGWGLIRQQLEETAPDPEAVAAFSRRFDLPAPQLPDAFEKSMARADHIADRLRREAALVSRKAELEVQLRQLENRRETIGTQIQAAKTAHDALSSRWRGEWEKAGIMPRSAMEMRAWWADIQALRGKLADLRSREAKAADIAAAVDGLRAALARSLTDAGTMPPDEASLMQLITLARLQVTAEEKHATRREAVEKGLAQVRIDLAAATRRREDIEAALKAWQGAWRQRVAAIGLDGETGPSAVMAVIERIKTAKTQLGEADTLKKRIEGIDRDAAAFKTRVDALVADLDPDLGAAPLEAAAESLQARLTAAREARATQKGLREHLSKATQDRQNAEQRIAAAEAAIAGLCREAGCEHPEDLATVEHRAMEKRRLLDELKTTREHIRRFAGGATIEAFIDTAAQVDIDAVAPDLNRLSDHAGALEQSRSALDEKIGDLRSELGRMDGSANAAELAQSAERLLGKIDSDVEAYARLKIASVLLARTIEQYREKYQGPLIGRASELFAQMTAGAFSGIRADYDDKGNPQLVGVRQNGGALIPVSGMSDGTADQLYLALRLSSLEQYLTRREPLPFVVDDILLRFDDARALATLTALVDFSKSTQVIFFTHHRHLVDLARDALDRSALHCLEL